MGPLWFWLIVLVWILVGCSHAPTFADPIQAIHEHPRITYQSLVPVEPVVEQCPPLASPDSAPATATPVESVVSVGAAPAARVLPSATPMFVAFQEDEWHIPPDHAEWSAILQALNPLGQYLVVGYSHGGGEQEHAILAQRRAEYIGSLLHEAGFPLDQIHRMASWSAHHDPFAPALGVQIFSLGPEATENRIRLADTFQPPS